ncbi:globin, protozoan/cyanobacterial family [Leptospira inadai serovar Lyme str. 10]|uniref:Globin, protozoan/cyanobacterial family n=2 Tax=Leptospira inadai serovar Lyme TaxID=293084 RepID=V6HFW0_9LEPT|nr:group II truncated hemoglobin [Leptospira inadai]EQA38803.1 globin, protozoan/cyanobacterial family [Leptospira inadai serovar Lyme str. 10]PNV74080.1 globin [Leptospira inadai serovar Lyme]
MNEKNKTPSLYEWAGGMQAFENLTKLFYQKVLQDDLLEPVFKHMSPDHQQRVAHFIAEVFGGPKIYSSEDGSHYSMIQKHLSKRLTEDQRKQWIRLLLETADEIGLPSDPEFRSAFVAYIEWGTRIAVNNSNTDELQMNPNEPMPKWGWGEPGGPYLPE